MGGQIAQRQGQCLPTFLDDQWSFGSRATDDNCVRLGRRLQPVERCRVIPYAVADGPVQALGT